MKPKLRLFTLVSLIACSITASAQTNAPAVITNISAPKATPPAAAVTNTATPAPTPSAAIVTNVSAPAVTPPAAAATNVATSAATPSATVATNAATPEATPSATIATNAAMPEATPPAGTTATVAAAPNALIPLIVMDDVPLTDAIRNLARQASINYMIDPKIGFGQTGPDGKVMAQVNVSIRWENITAEQALYALLSNYGLQMAEDPKTKISRVTIKDPAAPDPLITKVLQLKYAGPSNVVDIVQNAFTDKRSKVRPDIRTSQLVVVATEKEMVEIEQLVDNLDTPTRQVLIEARLLETQINPSTVKGVDWSQTLSAQHVTFGNGTLDPTKSSSTTTLPGTPTTTLLPGGGSVSTTPSSSVNTILSSIVGSGVAGLSLNTASGLTPNIGFLNADGVSAVLSFLNSYAETKVISSPRTVTLDNELAVIEVGTMFPVVNTTAGTANTTGGSSISYSNLTVRLEVTPRISANNLVNLKVIPTVLRLGDLINTTVGSQNNSVYSFQSRTMNTRVMIPSGNTLVMGGLIQDNIQLANSKVPLLGDIPGLGYLFRHDSKTRTKSNLTVFITPTIVQDTDYQPVKTHFLETPAPKSDYLENDWPVWDSGQAKDWSAPKAKASQKQNSDESAAPKTASSASIEAD